MDRRAGAAVSTRASELGGARPIVHRRRSEGRHPSTGPAPIGLPGMIWFCRAALMVTTIAAAAHVGAAPERLMLDPGFEALRPGIIAPTGHARRGWEVQAVGRDAVRDRLTVTCIRDPRRSHSGRQSLSLSIPEDASGFEFVTVGQRVRCVGDTVYEAVVWVRWPDGPTSGPSSARPSAENPSAIVSFWARDRNGKGHFAGKDVWLYDNRWTRLSFQFCPTSPEEPTFIYVSLLPNQSPRETTVLIDDFDVRARRLRPEREERSKNLLARLDVGERSASWRFVQMGGSAIGGVLTGSDQNRRFRMSMPRSTSNYESAQLAHDVDVRAGTLYRIRCRIRWVNRAPGIPPPIVNYGIFDERSGVWYGPIDQALDSDAGWREYTFEYLPPVSGLCRVYVQLNGWGNSGREVIIEVSDFELAPSSG